MPAVRPWVPVAIPAPADTHIPIGLMAAGGIIGAFLVALLGALVSGYALPAPGLPTENPPGLGEAFWALPGSIIALAASYVWASREPE